MEYFERYHREKNWYNKILLIEVYHLKSKGSIGGWTINKTATFFGISVGLVSENLALAETIHRFPELVTCESRQDALKRMNELIRGENK